MCLFLWIAVFVCHTHTENRTNNNNKNQKKKNDKLNTLWCDQKPEKEQPVARSSGYFINVYWLCVFVVVVVSYVQWQQRRSLFCPSQPRSSLSHSSVARFSSVYCSVHNTTECVCECVLLPVDLYKQAKQITHLTRDSCMPHNRLRKLFSTVFVSHTHT